MMLPLNTILERHAQIFVPVVPFDPVRDRWLAMDFTEANEELTAEGIENNPVFCEYINAKLKEKGARYGIGGYAEHRTVYSRSRVFDAADGGEPRRLHLGVDVWGAAGTPVFAPLGGVVHSFQFNNRDGDYGATIILQHQLEGYSFYTLYGHLSLVDLQLKRGQYIATGEAFAHFGMPEENGNWPPHLHFQIITDMHEKEGDYPGVCRYSEKEFYLANCPDPGILLQMSKLHLV